MTTKSNPTGENPYTGRDHENDRANDTLAVAQLFNRVGSELTTVDHHTVGDGLGRAQRLDPRVVNQIENTNVNPPPPPQQLPVPPEQMPVAVTNAPEQEIPQPVVEQIPLPAPPTPETSSVPLTDALDEVARVLTSRVDSLEDKLHIHFNRVNESLQSVLNLHESIVKRLSENSTEMVIKIPDQSTSEDTN